MSDDGGFFSGLKKGFLNNEKQKPTELGFKPGFLVGEALSKPVQTLTTHMKDRIAFDEERLNKLHDLHAKQEELKMKEMRVNVLRKWLGSGGENNTEEVEKEESPLIANKLSQLDQNQSSLNQVRLNVGGTIFVTSVDTLMKKENVIKVMLDTEFHVDRDDTGAILFPDQDPKYFGTILDSLRGDDNLIQMEFDDSMSNQELCDLLEESQFFGTMDLSQKIRAELKKRTNKNAIEAVGMKVKKDVMVEVNRDEMSKSLATDRFNEENSDWVAEFARMTSNNKRFHNEYLDKLQKTIAGKIASITEIENELNNFDLGVSLSLRGTKFEVPLSVIINHPDCILFKYINDKTKDSQIPAEIYFDRDPAIFEMLLEYMKTGQTDFPSNYYMLKSVKRDAKYFNITKLLKTFFNRYRYPIETIGPKNILMKENEDIIRKMFVQDRKHPVLNDNYINLLPIFEAPTEMDEETQNIPQLFDTESYQPKLCDGMGTFLENWNAFTHGLFENFDWKNVFVAGGSVLACLMELDDFAEKLKHTNVVTNTDQEQRSYLSDSDSDDYIEDNNDSDVFVELSDEERQNDKEREQRQKDKHLAELKLIKNKFNSGRRTPQNIARAFMHSPFNKSDVDLFLYGLTKAEAEKKVYQIYETFTNNLEQEKHSQYWTKHCNCEHHNDVFILRTEHAISFMFSYPIRPIQIVLRLYKSPAEILMGFDIDSCCVGFDGHSVWSLPRARRAIANRVNLVDVDRQSTTYEIRLYKYSKRGFRVAVPGFHRKKVKNTDLDYPSSKNVIFSSYSGLARLLFLENAARSRHARMWRQPGIPNDDKSAEHSLLTNDGPLRSRPSDYSTIYIPFNNGCNPAMVYDALKLKMRYAKQYNSNADEPWKPKILFSLNRLEFVLNDVNHRSSLPQKLEWIEIDPGRQYVTGSFHPTNKNFFYDAYAPSRQERHNRIANITDHPNQKRLYKVTYTYHSFRPWTVTTCNAKETKKLENAYRTYKTWLKNNMDKVPDDSLKLVSITAGTVNLQTMVISSLYGYGSRIARNKQYVGFQPVNL